MFTVKIKTPFRTHQTLSCLQLVKRVDDAVLLTIQEVFGLEALIELPERMQIDTTYIIGVVHQYKSYSVEVTVTKASVESVIEDATESFGALDDKCMDALRNYLTKQYKEGATL